MRFARLSCRAYAVFACIRVLLMMLPQLTFVVAPIVALNLIPSIVTWSWKLIPSAVVGVVQFAIARAFDFFAFRLAPVAFHMCV
jgi:hypothetical protein